MTSWPAAPARAGLDTWTRRLPGLDVARAAALIGMFAAHVGDAGVRGSDADGWHWLWIADGRSSALFAVLAGVTLSIMFTRDPHGQRHAAVRVATRGALLIAAGYLLHGLGTPLDVVLTNLGLMFLLVLPAMSLRAPMLLGLGATVMVGGALLYYVTDRSLDGIPVLEKLTSANYPAIAWTGLVLVGMGVGRLPLRERRTAGWLAWSGTLVAATAYGTGALLGGALPWEENSGRWWSSLAAHSDSPFELLGNAGVALLIIGVCLLVARSHPVWFPALAFGSMSLSVYTAQVVMIAVIGDQIVRQPSNVSFAVLSLALMVAATIWRSWRGAGPLERLVTSASTKAADALAAPRESGSAPRP